MSITIIHPGLMATVQDRGRFGSQRYGVIVSGAADLMSHRLANILVGNDENAATMEVTMFQTAFRFNEETLFAITGANLRPLLNGKEVPMWRPLLAQPDDELRFQAPLEGSRAYVSFAGGLLVPAILNSKSTYLRAHIGGWKGRALQRGDTIPFGLLHAQNEQMKRYVLEHTSISWSIRHSEFVSFEKKRVIRFTEGLQYEAFTEDAKLALEQTTYTMTAQSDRMGCRLSGEPLRLKRQKELLSEAVTAGTIQIPNNGLPIVLLADRQTTGGYPKIGQVISVDLPRVAQLRPGETIQFKKITVQEAERLYLEREWLLHQLQIGIALKIHN